MILKDRKEIEKKYYEWRENYCRCIHPIYIKTELDNKVFDKTLTLVKYNNQVYGLSAKHGFENIKNFKDEVYILNANYKFINLVNDNLNVIFCNDCDLVIIKIDCEEIKKFYSLKIDIPQLSIDEMSNSFISWNGFPYSKIKSCLTMSHNSRSGDSFQKEISNTITTNPYTNQREVEGIPSHEVKVSFTELNQDVFRGKKLDKNDIKDDFPIENSINFKISGMSGGPVWIEFKANENKQPLFYPNEPPILLAIGIEYHKKKGKYDKDTIIGISIYRIIQEIINIEKKQ